MTYTINANLNESSPRANQPDLITIPLKEHQKTVIYHGRKLENMKPINISNNRQMMTQFGVICDHVGAGKSYEALGIIADSPSLHNRLALTPLTKRTSGYDLYDESKKVKVDVNIIVVPHGVFKQWSDYITKSTKLKVYCVNTFASLKALVSGYKLDDLYDDSDPIEDPTVDSILGNLRSFEINKGKVARPDTKLARDTGYYRYLDLYYEDHPEKNAMMDQYGVLNVNLIKEMGNQIILVSSTMYNEMAFYFIKDNYYVNRVMFDEADSINIKNNLKIDAIFYWFITSSSTSLCNPDGVKNTVMEKKKFYGAGGKQYEKDVEKTVIEKAIKCTGFIKNTFKQFEGDPDRKHYYLKNDDSFIETSFKLPEPVEHLILCRDNLQIKVLNGIVSGDVLMMLNAGDVGGAIERLTCEKGTEDNIISVVTKRLEQKIVEFRQELEEKKTKEYATPKAKQEALERSQKKIQEAKRRIQSIEERIKGAEYCEICFDNVTKPAVTNCCQNVFCFECIAMALAGKNICPKCRSSLTLDNLMIIKDKEEEPEKTSETPVKKTKEMVLGEILKECNANDKYTNLEAILEYKKKFFSKDHRKILIFSEHEGSFNTKVISILDKLEMKYSRIKGTSMSINKTLREYRGIDLKKDDTEIEVLLINSRYFGAGLNLENSSDMIMLHRLPADNEHQVIGRGQRMGRKFPLTIWRLYHNNENHAR
jgi:hypothetical protein